MTKSLRIHLKRGERIYLNGAVIEVDRKVSLTFLNNVSFLLAQHVMQPEEATTPLKQLYILIQTMLIVPKEAQSLKGTVSEFIEQTKIVYGSDVIARELSKIEELIVLDRYYEAMKSLSVLFDLEAQLPKAEVVNLEPELMESTCS